MCDSWIDRKTKLIIIHHNEQRLNQLNAYVNVKSTGMKIDVKLKIDWQAITHD